MFLIVQKKKGEGNEGEGMEKNDVERREKTKEDNTILNPHFIVRVQRLSVGRMQA